MSGLGYKISLMILPVLLLYSCETELKIKPDDFPTSLVLNGIVAQDSLFKINVSRSATLNDIYNLGDLLVTDAVVKLYDGESFIETMQHDSLGFYSSSIIAAEGRTYYITAEKEGYPVAKAKLDFVLDLQFSIKDFSVVLRDTVFQYDLPSPGGEINFTNVKINYSIMLQDNPDEENFYSFDLFAFLREIVYNHRDNTSFEDYEVSVSELYYGRTYSYIDRNQGIDYGPYIKHYGRYNGFGAFHFDALNDKLFNGSSHTIKFKTGYYTTSVEPVKIKIVSYPTDLIRYYESLDNYQNTYDNPYVEPSNIFCNIENGIGFVCGVPCKTIEVNIQ